MSEQMPRNHEAQKPSHEVQHVPKNHEIHRKNHEAEQAVSAEKKAETLSVLREEVEKKSIDSEHVPIGQSESKKEATPQRLINTELKDLMFVRTLSRIQKQLSPTQRTLSKVVHAKPVDKISSIGEKTIARPYGILGGSALALLGSLFSTYLSKHFGMKYNLVVFILLFTIGYCLTTILELIFKGLSRSRR